MLDGRRRDRWEHTAWLSYAALKPWNKELTLADCNPLSARSGGDRMEMPAKEHIRALAALMAPNR